MAVSEKIYCLVLPALFLMQVDLCRAQEYRDTTVVLPGITVTATRSRTTTSAAPMRVTVMDEVMVDRSGVHSLSELLTARTGAFIKPYGDGGLSTISLRGTSAQQTLLLLDGHRLSDPQLGQMDLSLIPAILLESVEVMYGAGSALYGGDAMGGVVNLRTRSAVDQNSFRAFGELGAFGGQTGGLLLRKNRGRVSILGLVEYDHADGDFPYTNEALFPPREVVRENADRSHLSLFSVFGFEHRHHELRISGWYSDAERGLPGLATTPSHGERQGDTNGRLWINDEVRFAWGILEVGGFVQRTRLNYVNRQLDLDQTGRTFTGSLDVGARVPVGSRWLLSTGISGGYRRAHHPALSEDAREYSAGVYALATGQLGRWLFYPALRTDTYVTITGVSRTAVNPRLGINVQPLEGNPLRVKVGAGRSFRMPTFNDRFWQPGGNPDLKPEQAWSYDGGLYLQRRRDATEVTVFASKAQDQIAWFPSSNGYWAPRNITRSRTLGVEVSYRRLWVWYDRYRCEGGLFYTLTDARKQSDPSSPAYDSRLRYIPRDQLKLYLNARLGFVGLYLAGRYTGRRYITEDASQYLDPHVILDARVQLTRQFSRMRTQLSFHIENVFDTEYAVVQHYPMPPRHCRLRLLIEFSDNESDQIN